MGAAEKIERAKHDRLVREAQARKKRRKMDKVTLLVLIGALCAMAGGLFFGGRVLFKYIEQKKAEDALTAMRDQTDGGLAELPDNAADLIRKLLADSDEPSAVEEEEPIEVSDEYLARLQRKIDFDTLLAESPDATRWLWVPGSDNIDYYVMQERAEGIYKYIWADLHGWANGTGSLLTPYVPGDKDTAHLLIFGHRMSRRDSMFSNLVDWRVKEKAEANQYVMLYYPDHSECWKIWTAENAQGTGIVYHIPYDLGSKKYQELIDTLDQNGLYHMMDKPSADTRLLILSTCDKTMGDSDTRFIVVCVPDIFYYYDTQTLSRGPLKGEVKPWDEIVDESNTNN